MIENPVALVTLIAAITALAFGLEKQFSWARKVGASLLVIAFRRAALGTPAGDGDPSPVYDAIGGPVTSLAIVWLLLSVRLRDLAAAGPRMLGAFRSRRGGNESSERSSAPSSLPMRSATRRGSSPGR